MISKLNVKVIVSFIAVLFFFSCSKRPQTNNIIELKSGWKFKTGDNIAYAKADFNDSGWEEIGVDKTWNKQGYAAYKGYAWYRIKVNIPEKLINQADLQDSLIFYMGKINDFDQIFLNGDLIGQNKKNMPQGSRVNDDFGRLKTSIWDQERRYALSVNDPRIKWNKENVIAIRVYDWGGTGGVYSGDLHIAPQDMADYLNIEIGKNNLTDKGDHWQKHFFVRNIAAKYSLKGAIQVRVKNNIEGESVYETTFQLAVSPKEMKKFSFTFPKQNESTTILYEVIFDKSVKKIEELEGVPYILTPPVKKQPQIKGALVYGQRPGKPFLYRIPATGERPLRFKVKGLPYGLSLNPDKGIIKGVVHKKGIYKTDIIVANEYGSDKKSINFIIGDKIALTPPMGWNSWNCWGLSVTQDKVYAAAKSFVEKGLADHGWSYINIDDGWEINGQAAEPKRKRNGEIRTNEKFPDMKKLGNAIHALGLKFGIYSSPGALTCGGYTASYNHEYQDARTFARWGVDYLKYDLCSYRNFMKDANDVKELTPPYEKMNNALSKIDRDIVYSLCEYGNGNVWEWGAKVGGNLWRTTGDIWDNWDRLYFIGFNQEQAAPYAGPGHWNDPDMLVIGRLGWSNNLHQTSLTPDEQYTHVSLWSLLAAPLLLGCDLENLDDFTLNLITNDEVLAIDQDALGIQAVPVIKDKNIHVYKKKLADGTFAVGIFNIGKGTQKYMLDFQKAGLKENVKLRDLWRQKDLGQYEKNFRVVIPAHGVKLLKVF